MRDGRDGNYNGCPALCARADCACGQAWGITATFIRTTEHDDPQGLLPGWATMSLRFRLNLLITVMLLSFMAVVGYVMIQGLRTSTQENVEAATRVTVQLLDTVIVSSEQNPAWGYTI